MRVCVFCGASPHASEVHLELARRTGRLLAEAGAGVVFGGGGHGMMGAVAGSAVYAGGEVIGVLPRFLFDREPPHPKVADLRVVETMHERKATMYDLADAFLTLPGGFGTIDETMEVMTWRQLALISKPVVFVGPADFWGGLEATFDAMHAANYLSDTDRTLAAFATTPEEALARLGTLTAPQIPAT